MATDRKALQKLVPTRMPCESSLEEIIKAMQIFHV